MYKDKLKQIEQIKNEIEKARIRQDTEWDIYYSGVYRGQAEGLETALEIIQSEPEETCTYSKWDDDSNSWKCSECGEVWTLNADSPKENNMNYCPKCGRKLNEKAGE